jgi:hypothetical protein
MHAYGHQIVDQLARDRFVEHWGVANNWSVFRIPETLKSRFTSIAAVMYMISAAKRDFETGNFQIHYLDFSKCYSRINEFAHEMEAVEPLITTPVENEFGIDVRVTSFASPVASKTVEVQ